MLRINLLELAKRNGVRRRRIKLRPVRPSLADKRTLRAIGNEMAATVFRHSAALVEAVGGGGATPRSIVRAGDGEVPELVIADSRDSIDRLLNLIVTETQQVMTRLQIEIRGWSQRVEQRQRAAFTASVFTSTGVAMHTILTPGTVDNTVEHYVTWATSLIRDIGDESRKRIGNAVLQAVRENIEPRDLAKTIRGIEDMTYRRAKNIASDQTTKLSAALDRARQLEVGITNFTWIHSGSPHPREWHEERDGQLFAWDDPEIDAGDFPGEPPFCGCIAQATLVDEAGNEIVAAGEEDLVVEE